MIFKKASYDPFKTEKLFLIVIIFHTYNLLYFLSNKCSLGVNKILILKII